MANILDDNNFNGDAAQAQQITNAPTEDVTQGDAGQEGIPQPITQASTAAVTVPQQDSLYDRATTVLGKGARKVEDAIEKATGGFGVFTPRAENLPSMDEFLNSTNYNIPRAASDILTGDFSSPAVNAVMDRSPVGKVITSIGSAVHSALNQGALGIEPDSDIDKELKDVGIFNDLEKGQNTFLRSADEAFIRPAAVAIDTGWRTATAILAGLSGGIEQTAAQIGGVAPELAEWAMTDISGIEGIMPHVPKPSDISKATEMGVYDGENTYFGLEVPTPEQMTNRINAAEETQALLSFVETKKAEVTVPSASEIPRDIHAVAREIAPATFNEFDRLSQQRDFLGDTMRELVESRREKAESEAPNYDDQIADMREKMKTANARSSNRMQAKIDELTAERTAFIDNAVKQDNGDINLVRNNYAKIDTRMRDMAPDVSAAYREAETRVPAPEQVAVAPENAMQTETFPNLREAQEQQAQGLPAQKNNVVALKQPETEIAPTALNPEQVKGIAQQLDNISKDVHAKVLAAGRSVEEANAIAQLESQHYKAVAEQGWTKGAPEEIYQRDAANIAGRGKVKKQTAQGLFRQSTNTIHLLETANASTMVHELGHEWLRQMMEYAKADDAPANLLKDRDTVNNWLGVKEGEEISTRQHEKFARGFERYLMEGIAPSKELAAIFAKFKQWLTDIYQTVKNLRSPINADIRGVFDRLLSAKPERTVIAPERPTAALVENLHEIQAEITPPAKAAEVAQKVSDTIDRIIQQTEPEIYNELKTAESSVRNAGGTSEVAGATEGASTAEPNATAPNEVQQPSEVGTGAGQTGTEGAELPREPESSRTAGAAEREISPDAPLEKNETKLIDKAGNVRLDNLDAPESVKQALRESADRKGGNLDMRRGVISDAQAIETAKASGLKVSDVKKFTAGKAYTKEEIFALNDLLESAAKDVADSQAKLTDTSTDEEYLQWYEKVARQEMILDTVLSAYSGATAEGGRTLQALGAVRKSAAYLESRQIADLLKENSGTDLFQIKKLAKVIGEMETPAQVAKTMVDARRPGIGAMALELLLNNYISGPITHKAYIVGNEITAMYRATLETAVEAAVGMTKGLISGEKSRRAYFSEILPQLRAIYKAHTTGISTAWESAKLGQTLELPHEQLDLMTERQRKLYDKARAKGATFENAVKSAGGTSGVKTPFTSTKAIPGTIGVLIRAPGERMVAPIHSFFRAMGYAQNIARQATRIALDEGLTGNARDMRIADLTANPTEDMMSSARFEANQQVLMGKGNQFTQKVSSFLNWEPDLPLLGPTKPLRFISPFINVKANIIDQALFQRGPLGLLFSGIRDDVMGKNGDIKQNSAIAKMALGSAISTGAAMLYMNGKTITPSAPKDYKEAAMSCMVDGPPHSLKIGDMYYDLSHLGSLGMQVGVAADVAHLYDRIGKDTSDKVGALIMHSIYNNLVEENSLGGLSDFFRATEDYNFGQHYAKALITSFTPYSVGLSQIDKATDPYMRQARTLLDMELSKLPWASESLEPRRDVWGQPIPNVTHGIIPGSDADVYQHNMSIDPVNIRLNKLGIFPATPRRQILGVQLTDHQYDQYSALAGQMAKQQLDKYIQMTANVDIKPGADHAAIIGIIANARKVAQGAVLQSYPEIQRIAEANARAMFETGKKPTQE